MPPKFFNCLYITSIRSNNRKQIIKVLLIDGQLGARIFHHPSAARSIGHHIPAAADVNCINHHELTKYTTTSCVGHQNWYPNNTHLLRVCVQTVDKSVDSPTHMKA
jgi:hypothetical protein